MPISVLGMDGNAWGNRDMDASGNNKVTTYHLLGFSGSYTTSVGGDTLDLSAIAAQIPCPGVPDQIVYELNGGTGSFSKTGGYFAIERHPTDNTKHKVKVFSSGGTEQGSGTYASILLNLAAEFVTIVCTWKKLLQQP